MPNRSHFNSGLRALNKMRRDGVNHSSTLEFVVPSKTHHILFIDDAIEILKKIPSESVQLILIDPPYNLDIAQWDTYSNYLDWARLWLNEGIRVLKKSGSIAIFGGMQYQGVRTGDLLELTQYLRNETDLRLVNFIIWYYKNGMSAHRFFANRHEEITWFAKTDKYYFDLDAVRIPFDEETKLTYMRDKRLNPESIKKGKNPTNVWEIGRLNGNSQERVGHPTQKPVELVRRLVKALSYPGSIVLDFFAGSGTTGRVCMEEKRHSIMVDSDPDTKKYLRKQMENMPPILNETFQLHTNPETRFLKDLSEPTWFQKI